VTTEAMIEGGSPWARERVRNTLQFLATSPPLAVGTPLYEDLLRKAQTDAAVRKQVAEDAARVRRDETESDRQVQRMVRWERGFGLAMLLATVFFTALYALPVVRLDPATATFNTQWVAWVAWSASGVVASFVLRYLERDLRFLRAVLEAIRDRQRHLAEGLERVATGGYRQ